MNKATTAVLAAGVVLGAAWGGAGVAAAGNSVAPGSPEGAVTISAKNLGHCKVEFEIVNKTNITSYTIDWRIDDEEGEAGREIPGVGPYYRTGGLSAKVQAGQPSYPDGGIAEGDNTADNRVLRSDLDPTPATYVRDLKDLPYPGTYSGSPIPNPDADTHKVAYRMVLGPPGNNGQTTTEQPEWIGDRQWREVTVTGCNSPEPSGSLDTGSLDSGSLDLGSLFG